MTPSRPPYPTSGPAHRIEHLTATPLCLCTLRAVAIRTPHCIPPWRAARTPAASGLARRPCLRSTGKLDAVGTLCAVRRAYAHVHTPGALSCGSEKSSPLCWVSVVLGVVSESRHAWSWCDCSHLPSIAEYLIFLLVTYADPRCSSCSCFGVAALAAIPCIRVQHCPHPLGGRSLVATDLPSTESAEGTAAFSRVQYGKLPLVCT